MHCGWRPVDLIRSLSIPLWYMLLRTFVTFVIFTFHSLAVLSNDDCYLETNSEKEEGRCAISLVEAPYWSSETYGCGAQEYPSDPIQTSFARRTLLAEDPETDLDGAQSPGLEMRNLSHHEQEECRVLPKMWWLLDGVLRRSASVELGSRIGTQISTTTQQQCPAQNPDQRCWKRWKRSRQGPQQRHRRESGSITLLKFIVCAYTGSFDTMALYGLREVSTGTGTSSFTTLQSIGARVGSRTPEGVPGKFSPSTTSARCNGASREFWGETDHQGLACSNVLFRTCAQSAPRSQRGQIQVEKQLDETPTRKYPGLGSTARYLSEEHGQTPGHGGQSAPGGGQCKKNDPATQLSIRRFRLRRTCIYGRATGCQSGQGGGKAETAVAGYYDYLLVDSWSHPQDRSPGDQLGWRGGRKRTEASQSRNKHQSGSQGHRYPHMTFGQTLPCQQKVSVIKAKKVTFEIAEAYHDIDHHGAARKSRSPILSTEEAAVYLHSVVHEFDYTHPFKAALNAFCLRGELVLAYRTRLQGNDPPCHPHVNDLWCDGLDGNAYVDLRKQLSDVESQKELSFTPLQHRLLDERNSASVSAESMEHPQVAGPEHRGDPEDEQLVIIDGWQDLLEILHQRTPSPDFMIHLEMYGLHITHHSIRITDCEATIAAIREAVQESWRDAMPPRSVAYCTSTGTATCSCSCSPVDR